MVLATYLVGLCCGLSAINILLSDNYVSQRKESDYFPRVEQVIFWEVDILLKNDTHTERCAKLMHTAQRLFTS